MLLLLLLALLYPPLLLSLALNRYLPTLQVRLRMQQQLQPLLLLWLLLALPAPHARRMTLAAAHPAMTQLPQHVTVPQTLPPTGGVRAQLPVQPLQQLVGMTLAA